MAGSAEHNHSNRMVAIVGRLGVYPMVKLSLPSRRVLAYLALRGRPVARAQAAADLWLDDPEDVGRANLRRALWHLPRGWVQAVGDELILDAACDLPDAHRIAAQALEGKPLSLDEIKLLSNDLLPGWHEEWVLPAYNAFRQLRVQALETTCRTMANAGNHALATQAGHAAITAEPLRESAAEALIQAHLAQHNRNDAWQVFQSFARQLDEELGISPDPTLSQLVVGIGRR